ncbi:uncharacterized protein CCOS01_09794 [Colletotrichum costaricense]|uniref:Uncharacterized protein n=1 Tax=Colletotrichum costaricense TaxID=1209916 RepID=A0AAJ0DYJ9_9PEZI|nr:uncharacterized protein CCOS01_09794 [Colletotrichum costaricense]KAK1522082.1 hypothetical protein CCOS01_09794 [Colletotrichum costaricense]
MMSLFTESGDSREATSPQSKIDRAGSRAGIDSAHGSGHRHADRHEGPRHPFEVSSASDLVKTARARSDSIDLGLDLVPEAIGDAQRHDRVAGAPDRIRMDVVSLRALPHWTTLFYWPSQ